jgi:hypothetical protein
MTADAGSSIVGSMGRLERTVTLVRAAGAVVRGDTRLALVPLGAVSAASVVGVATAAGAALTLRPRTRQFGSAYRTAGFGVADAHRPPSSAVTTMVPTWVTFVVVVTGYLLVAFVLTYALAVVAAATHEHLARPPDATGVADGRPSLAGAAGRAFRRWPQLLAWSTFGGLIGVLHRVLEKRAVLGAFTGRPMLISWRRAAWLAIPVVVVEGRAPLGSLLRSNELLDRTWGDGAQGRTGLGIVAAALFMPVGAAAMLFGSRGTAGLAVTVALLTVVSTVIATLSVIIRTALYAHATGHPVPGFDAAALAGAFRERRARPPALVALAA